MFKAYLQLSKTTHLLCFGAFINRAGAFVVPFLTIYLQQRLGLGSAFATFAIGVYGAGGLGALLTGGHLADQIGRKKVMVGALVGSAILLSFLGSLQAPWAILVTIFGFAFIAEMYRPAAMAMLADVNLPDQRSHAFSEMYVAVNLGFAIAASAGGWLSQYSFHWLFWGDALTALVFATIICFTISETLTKQNTAGQSTTDYTKNANISTLNIPLWQAIKHIACDRCFVAYWLASFFLAATYMQSMSTLPLYLADLGIGAATYGNIIAVNGIMIVCLQLPTTALASKFQRSHVIILSAIIVGIGFGSICLASVPWQFGLAVAIWTIGEMMNSPTASAVISDLAPSNMRARYMGVYSMCYALALMLGAPLGGLVLSRFSGPMVWLSCAALGGLAALFYWIGGRLFAKRDTVIPIPV